MKLLVTVRADENIGGYTKYTMPTIKEHAKKWGADFKLLSDESICPVGNGKFHYRILELYNLLDEYDRILNLDADMVITKNCPNPFDVVEYDKIATIFEDKGTRRADRFKRVNEMQNKHGNVGWNGGYINTGFFMVSKLHKDLFKVDDPNKLWVGSGFDDVYLAYRIAELDYKIQEMSYKFNHMTMFSEGWNGNKDRFDSNIIHYAGGGLFDKSLPNKIEQIRLDYEKVNE
jgi:hypothetical protein